MARAIWTGSVSFGLVNIPVGLYSAVSEKTLRFNQLERGTSDRIRYKRVNERTGKEVAYEEIVKGYDVGGGQYVVLTPEELQAVEPAGTRSIEIEDFVDQADIDPVFYNQAYYVAPSTDAAARPYALLIDAMRSCHKVGIARFVMRSREYLSALRADGDVLCLETMYFADEVRDPSKEVEVRPSGEPAKERELAVALSLIESMATKWDPAGYHDRYRARVEELIAQKVRGEQVLTVAREAPATNVVDLMDALRRSVEQVRETRDSRTAEAGAANGSGRESRRLAGSLEASSGAPAGRRPKARAATKRQAPGRAAPATGARGKPATAKTARKPKGQSEQLAMMSREELYQLAQDIDVPGRSKMTRDQLARAVAKAEGSRRAS